MFDEKWQLWITASLNKYFKEGLAARGIIAHVEGDEMDTSALGDFVEVRIDGPYFRERARHDFLVKVEVNLLVQSTIEVSKNLYTPQVMSGIASALMARAIPIQKYPDSSDYLGCLRIDDDRPRDICRVSDFGQIETDTPIRQFTIECHYKMELRGI